MTPLDEMNRHVAAAADLLKALAHPDAADLDQLRKKAAEVQA